MKNKTLQEQYILLKEGKGSSNDFLREATRQFPQLITNSTPLSIAEGILRSKNIINENYIDLKPMGLGFEGKHEESWEVKYKNYLKEVQEEIKADSKKPSGYVGNAQKQGFDQTDKKDPKNQSFQQILLGAYAESQIEKNYDKGMEEIMDIVIKNLSKDPLHYVKNNMFGVEGLEGKQLDDPLEPKGIHKSSGYGDLDKVTKSFLNEGLMRNIYENEGFTPSTNIVTEVDNEVLLDLLDQYGTPEEIDSYIQSLEKFPNSVIGFDEDDFIEDFKNYILDKTDDLVDKGPHMDINENLETEPGLLVKLGKNSIKPFEIWLDQSRFYATQIDDSTYFFPEDEANFDNLERFLEIDFAAEDFDYSIEGVYPKSFLHEGKKQSIQDKIKEIEKTGDSAALEAKINGVQMEIDERQNKIDLVAETEELAEFVNKSQIKSIEKEIKDLIKIKEKYEKLYQKATGSAKQEVIVGDVNEDNNDETYDEEEEETQEEVMEGFEIDDERYHEDLDDKYYSQAYDAMDYDDDEKIDFLSLIKHPEENDNLEFQNLDKLSPKTLNTLFESYFPQKVRK